MKAFSAFCIGMFLTLIACNVDPTLAGQYPPWLCVVALASQAIVFVVHWW